MFKHFRAKCNALAAKQHLTQCRFTLRFSLYQLGEPGPTELETTLSPSHHRPHPCMWKVFRPCVHLQAEYRKDSKDGLVHPPHSPGFATSLWRAPLALLGAHVTLASVTHLKAVLVLSSPQVPGAQQAQGKHCQKLESTGMAESTGSRSPKGCWLSSTNRPSVFRHTGLQSHTKDLFWPPWHSTQG